MSKSQNTHDDLGTDKFGANLQVLKREDDEHAIVEALLAARRSEAGCRYARRSNRPCRTRVLAGRTCGNESVLPD